MIASVNSYPNYNNYNTSLNSQTQIKNSQNTSLENKKANRSISPKETNSNLVSDVSQATSQILGYGVDKEGFFTSDFNEAAGLPKDYRIYAKGVENFANYTTTGTFFTNLDIAKSFNRAYQVFSQLAPKVEGNFTQEDIDKIPQWFQYNDKNLQVTKIYTKDEYKNINYTKESLFSNLRDGLSFPSLNKLGLDFIDKNNDIFEPSRQMNIGENAYKNNDGSVSKGGVLMAFFAGMSGNEALIQGETTISGKLAGLDDNFNTEQMKELYQFLNDNPILYGITDNPGAELLNRFKLKSTFTNVDEFKKEWLKMKAQSDKAGKEYKAQIANQSSQMSPIKDNENTEKTDNKPFKPIQVESKSQTYKETDRLNALELAKDRQLANMLEILFNFKSNSSLNNTDKNNLLSLFSKMNLNPTSFKGLDIKV